MYGFVPPTRHISLMGVPQAFANGGIVSAGQAFIPKEFLPRGDVDTVPARLEPGEMVIPRKHVPIVKRFLVENKIYLPNF
jgi:hypothetical protein